MRPATLPLHPLLPTLAALMLSVLPLLGCALHRGQTRVESCSAATCAVQPKVILPLALEAERPNINWERLPDLQGEPLEIAEATSVRLLSWEEVLSLAPRGDATSRLLRNSLTPSINGPADGGLQRALAHQSRHAAQTAAARAGEAYLGLQECYLQNQLLIDARTGSDKQRRMLAKFRENGIDAPLDSRELDRQQLELNGQFARLAKEYQTATTGLELLLNLENQPTLPIWPTTTQLPLSLCEELPRCLETALASRADRQALLTLGDSLERLPLEKITALAGSFSPWGGLLLPLPVKTLLGCHREEDEAIIREKFREQLCELVAENEKQIRLEVNLAFARRWEAAEQVNLQASLLESLTASLSDLEAMRDVESVDVERFFQLEQRVVAAKSQLVTAVINQAKADLELARAIGSLSVSE